MATWLHSFTVARKHGCAVMPILFYSCTVTQLHSYAVSQLKLLRYSCLVAWFHNCFVIWFYENPDTGLKGYMVRQMTGYMVNQFWGYKTSRLHGYSLTRLQSYTVTHFFVTQLLIYTVTKLSAASPKMCGVSSLYDLISYRPYLINEMISCYNFISSNQVSPRNSLEQPPPLKWVSLELFVLRLNF